MLSTSMLAIKRQLSLGEQDVPLHVFLVFEVVVLIDLVRVLSVTCAEVVVCLLQLKPGENGIDVLIKNKEDMQFALHWQQAVSLLC
jgi:hypothetical protein